MWSITHLVTPAEKKRSLRKDRNWYIGVFFPFHHILKLQSLCRPFPFSHMKAH